MTLLQVKEFTNEVKETDVSPPLMANATQNNKKRPLVKEQSLLCWNNKKLGITEKNISTTIRSTANKSIRQAPLVKEITSEKKQAERVYSPEGCGITLSSLGGGMGAKTGLYVVASRGRNVGGKFEQQAEINEEGVTNTITNVQKDNLILQKERGFRVRRLTPRECERIQGLPDDFTKHGCFEDGTKPISDSQRYKMCGNAITSVPPAIILKFFIENLTKSA